ncbi:hypothetical protein NM208_g14149 [Fusarium decemcellulare]|uniref:Uncharacterized protein n=1 Tax=Fusarium decemcellulare TaxID=57161 RepID=A0ACC1RIZ0_9HYPO|nr:hypothetical protein NM208_g14149 [Fusarium decemcellulare]
MQVTGVACQPLLPCTSRILARRDQFGVLGWKAAGALVFEPSATSNRAHRQDATAARALFPRTLSGSWTLALTANPLITNLETKLKTGQRTDTVPRGANCSGLIAQLPPPIPSCIMTRDGYDPSRRPVPSSLCLVKPCQRLHHSSFPFSRQKRLSLCVVRYRVQPTVPNFPRGPGFTGSRGQQSIINDPYAVEYPHPALPAYDPFHLTSAAEPAGTPRGKPALTYRVRSQLTVSASALTMHVLWEVGADLPTHKQTAWGGEHVLARCLRDLASHAFLHGCPSTETEYGSHSLRVP